MRGSQPHQFSRWSYSPYSISMYVTLWIQMAVNQTCQKLLIMKLEC